MKLLAFLLGYSRGALLLAMGAGLLSGLASAGLLAVINMKLTGEPSQGRALVWAFVALVVLAPASRVLSSYLLIRLSQRAVYDLRLRLTRQILASPLRRLEELGPHRLLASLTRDVASMANALANLPLLCMNLAIVAGSLVYLGYLSPTVLLILIVVMALGITSYQLPTLIAMRKQRLAREQTDVMYKHYRGVIDGVKELKLHAPRRRAFLGLLDANAAALQRLNVAVTTIFSATGSWGQMLVFIVVGLMVFAAGEVTIVDQGVLVGYVVVVLYLMTPLEVILDTIPQLTEAEVSLRKLEELGLSLGEEAPRAAVEAPEEAAGATWRELELAGVRHSYRRDDNGETFTLGPIDVTLRAGELVFLTGGNGSGKTTLAKLVAGLYQPQGGEIRVDGLAVTESTVEDHRQRFSVVFSSPFLFESLLGLGVDGLDQRAERFLEELALAQKVQVKGGELSTIDLSQGQQKRLALLTAYLEDRSFYIFDEWAADQDPVFKEVFYHRLLLDLRARGKTVLVISHDDRYYDVADRLIKLDEGRIVLDSLSAPQRSSAG